MLRSLRTDWRAEEKCRGKQTTSDKSSQGYLHRLGYTDYIRFTGGERM
jgi:hypothetical protein